MFNLLPDSFKEDLRKEYKLRRYIIILLFISFVQLSSLVFLFPSWATSSYKEEAITAEVEKMNQADNVSNSNSIRSSIRSLNKDLSLFDSYLKYTKAMPFFDVILSKKTSSIRITNMTYSSVSTSTATINLQGFSSTRDSLVNFKKNLDDSKAFINVDLPISNYAKDKDINFSMSLTISQNI